METEPRYHLITASEVVEAAAPVAAALGVSVTLAKEGNDPLTIDLAVGVDRVRVTPSVAACLLLGLVASSGVDLRISGGLVESRSPRDIGHIVLNSSDESCALRRVFVATMRAFSQSVRTARFVPQEPNP